MLMLKPEGELNYVWSYNRKTNELAFFKTQSAKNNLKGVLNPNFRPFSIELKKIRFFKINFYLGFRGLWPQTLKIFEILFPRNSLMTSLEEPQ